jgi:hypothetical protein
LTIEQVFEKLLKILRTPISAREERVEETPEPRNNLFAACFRILNFGVDSG